MTLTAQDLVTLPDAPEVPGLVFRRFRGESDYPGILAVHEGCREADGDEWVQTLDDVAVRYTHLVNCDLQKDLVFAEVDGQMIGFGRSSWSQEINGPWRARVYVALLPAWRQLGIREALLRQCERRMRQVAAELKPAGELVFDSWADGGEAHWASVLESAGYRPMRYGYSMVRPNLEGIPDLPLPEGLEVRPAQPEHYRAIWEANVEAFRDHWGFSEPNEAWYDEWLTNRFFQPQLWQVAWEGDQVAGMVLNFVNEEENRVNHRLRGYTEDICVRRPWRRRGLAKALITRSQRMFRDMGMTEVSLGVDTENPNGALQLYESLGYRPIKRETCYRKPLD